ncbi:unnamed protein product, partial [Heterosigma akashiwo]
AAAVRAAGPAQEARHDRDRAAAHRARDLAPAQDLHADRHGRLGHADDRRGLGLNAGRRAGVRGAGGADHDERHGHRREQRHRLGGVPGRGGGPERVHPGGKHPGV